MPTRSQVRKTIIECRSRHDNFTQVSAELYGGLVGITVLSQIASPTPYWPKKKEICDILQPPEPLKDMRLRPLQCLSTEAEYTEMKKATTRERTIRLLGDEMSPRIYAIEQGATLDKANEFQIFMDGQKIAISNFEGWHLFNLE